MILLRLILFVGYLQLVIADSLDPIVCYKYDERDPSRDYTLEDLVTRITTELRALHSNRRIILRLLLYYI